MDDRAAFSVVITFLPNRLMVPKHPFCNGRLWMDGRNLGARRLYVPLDVED